MNGPSLAASLSPTIAYDVAHLLGATTLLLAFLMLTQRRLQGLLRLLALQGLAVAAAAAWRAEALGAEHLWLTAVIAAVKALAAPLLLGWIIRRLGTLRAVETALGIGPSLIVGILLVFLSIELVQPILATRTVLAAESIAIALAIVLLGLLMMITRRNAISQVVGFLGVENGLVLAAIGAQGMPLVVEMSVAVSVFAAIFLFGIFFFRIRERFDSLDDTTLARFRDDLFHGRER